MSNGAMNNETYLDWLARNVHVWPDGMREVLVCYPRNVDTLIWSCVLSNTGWITKEQWLARRAELQNKPGWEGAPEWAELLAQDDSGEWYWYAAKPAHPGMKSWWPAPGAKNAQCGKGEVLGDWRDTLEKRPEQNEFEPFVSIEDGQEFNMSQQQEVNQDGGWFERGELPPVGTRCEALITSERQWVEIEVVCHRDGCALGWCPKERCGYHGDEPTDFRPVLTERDVAIEEMCQVAGLDGLMFGLVAGKLYDAGYRKESK